MYLRSVSSSLYLAASVYVVRKGFSIHSWVWSFSICVLTHFAQKSHFSPMSPVLPPQGRTPISNSVSLGGRMQACNLNFVNRMHPRETALQKRLRKRLYMESPFFPACLFPWVPPSSRITTVNNNNIMYALPHHLLYKHASIYQYFS